MCKRNKGTRGFTLIELLVVIAIIALLISILLPSLNKAKDLAKRLTCMTTVRSHVVPFMFYADENNDWFPIYRYHDQGPWMFKILPYLDRAEKMDSYSFSGKQAVESFQCPLDRKRNSISRHTTSYGMNQGGYSASHNWGLSHCRRADVLRAADTVLEAESAGRDGLGEIERAWIRPSSRAPIKAAHDEYANISWVDGHVSTEEAALITADSELWNRTDQGYFNE